MAPLLLPSCSSRSCARPARAPGAAGRRSTARCPPGARGRGGRATRAVAEAEAGAGAWAPTRRAAMAAAAALGLVPAGEAGAMVSGYEKDAGGFTYAVLQHETPKFEEWKKVFDEKWGEQGPPDFGVVRTIVLKGPGVETDGDSLAVVVVFPDDKLKTIAPFYDQKKNPLWAQARSDGWLTGEFRQLYGRPQIWRGYPGDQGPPNLKGKAMGIYSAKLGIPLEPDFIASFTSPDSDKLHAANGVTGSLVGTTSAGSDLPEGNLSVVHFHNNLKQAKGLVDMFNEKKPPFDEIVAAGVLKEPIRGAAYQVVSDKTDEAAIKKLMGA